MRYAFQGLRAWDIVQGTEIKPEETPATRAQRASWDERDWKARSCMIETLDDKYLLRVDSCETSAQMWQMLKDKHEVGRDERHIKQDFLNLRMHPGDSVLDFIEQVEDLAGQLYGTEEEVHEWQEVLQVLENLTPDFDPHVAASSFKRADLTWQNVTGTLLSAEARAKRRKEQIGGSNETALFTRASGRPAQDRWQGGSAFTNQTSPQDTRECYSCHEFGHIARYCPRQPGRNMQGGVGRAGVANQLPTGRMQPPQREWRVCHNCRQPGHLWRYCPSDAHHAPGLQEERGPRGRAYLAEGNQDAPVVAELPHHGRHDGEAGQGFGHVFVAVCLKVGAMGEGWWLDSGATHHMCFQREVFQTLEDTKAVAIMTADDMTHTAVGKGSVVLEMRVGDNWKAVTLREVLYVPSFRVNLVSMSKVQKAGHAILVKLDGQLEVTSGNGEVVAEGRQERGLFKLHCQVMHQDEGARAHLASAQMPNLWHLRLGHLHREGLRQMSSELIVTGVGKCNGDLMEVCTGCAEGKLQRKPFNTKPAEAQSNVRLQVIHSDLCGPMHVKSLGGAVFFLTFIDDFSRKVWIYLLREKSGALASFKTFKQQAEKHTGNKLLELITDGGGEYTSREFETFCEEEGMVHRVTLPRSPQLNGVAERMNRTLTETARSMLFYAKLALRFWGEAINTAAYVRNRCPSRTLRGKTPEGVWTGKIPDVSHLRVFGCQAYVHVADELRRKLEKKAESCVFLGYDSSFQGYRLSSWGQKRLIRSRDVVFNEFDFRTQETEFGVGQQPESSSMAESRGWQFLRSHLYPTA